MGSVACDFGIDRASSRSQIACQKAIFIHGIVPTRQKLDPPLHAAKNHFSAFDGLGRKCKLSDRLPVASDDDLVSGLNGANQFRQPASCLSNADVHSPMLLQLAAIPLSQMETSSVLMFRP